MQSSNVRDLRKAKEKNDYGRRSQNALLAAAAISGDVTAKKILRTKIEGIGTASLPRVLVSLKLYGRAMVKMQPIVCALPTSTSSCS
jgi:hypothetical protein